MPDFNIDLSISHGLLQPGGLSVLGLFCGLAVWYRPTKRITSERDGLRGGHCFIPVLLFSHAVYEHPVIVGSRSQHRNIPTAASRHLQHRDVTFDVASGDYPMSSRNGD